MNKQQTNIIGICGGMRCGKDSIGSMIQYLTSDHGINGTRTYEDAKGKVDMDGYGYANFHRYSTEWQIKKFADKLKDMVCLLIGCSRRDLENEDFKNSPLTSEWDGYRLTNGKLITGDIKVGQAGYRLELTPRIMLQKLGTELMRQQLHPNVWVNATFADYKSGYVEQGVGFVDTEEDYPKWVITDVRFENEAQKIKDMGGILIDIRRPFSLRFPEYSDYGLEYDFDHDRLSSEQPDMYAKLTHASEIGLKAWNNYDYIIENDGTMDDLLGKVDEVLIKENIK